MARIFVAVPLPDHVRDLLDERLDVMRSVRPQLRWVRPENFHVTVHFIGECGPREVDRQLEYWSGRAANARSLQLHISGAGTFPQPWRAKVLYAAARVDGDAWRALAGPDQVPHVTVARARELTDLTGALIELESLMSEAWVADEIEVVQSFLERGRPARYETVERLPLG